MEKETVTKSYTRTIDNKVYTLTYIYNGSVLNEINFYSSNGINASFTPEEFVRIIILLNDVNYRERGVCNL